jgi:hypothetical protein
LDQIELSGDLEDGGHSGPLSRCGENTPLHIRQQIRLALRRPRADPWINLTE